MYVNYLELRILSDVSNIDGNRIVTVLFRHLHHLFCPVGESTGDIVLPLSELTGYGEGRSVVSNGHVTGLVQFEDNIVFAIGVERRIFYGQVTVAFHFAIFPCTLQGYFHPIGTCRQIREGVTVVCRLHGCGVPFAH